MQPDLSALWAGLDEIHRSPMDCGKVELIVRRPAEDQREIVTEGFLDTVAGLAGDGWLSRGADPDRQITLMNARVIALLTRSRKQWPLAGDQLFVDLDLSNANLSPGSRLRVGSALLEVTAEPHRGCKKFAARFGLDALRFVNSQRGSALGLRGINARVVQAGVVRPGDPIERFLAHVA